MPQTYESCTPPLVNQTSGGSAGKQQEIGSNQPQATAQQQMPLSTLTFMDAIEKIMQTTMIIPYLLILIIIILLGIIYYQDTYVQREKRVDKTVTMYITNALNKGFSEEQIQTKLLNSGFGKEEIDFVFRKLNRKK